MKLYVDERGCYHEDMKYDGASDMENFRVCCEVFDTKNRVVFVEFGEMAGKNKGQLYVDISYTENGNCWWINPVEEYGLDSTEFSYNKQDVLRYINKLTGENYTKIVPYYECYVAEHYRNWTGSGLMMQWVRDHKDIMDVQLIHSYMSTYIKWDGRLWEWEKVIAENPKNAEYPDVTFSITRITDPERVKRLLENAVEVINTVTA